MHRFYAPATACRGEVILLEDQEAHHLVHVLRLRCGDEAEGVDGAGGIYSCVISGIAKRTAELKITTRRQAPAYPALIRLFQAVPKGKTFDALIQKATELGVSRIVPVLSERAVPHLEDERCERKQEKWQQTALEACKQCGQAWMPIVEKPAAFSEAVEKDKGNGLRIVASLQPGSRVLRHHMEAYRAANGRKPESISLWIGPEGDFTVEEIERLMAAGAKPITLGNLVLRVETAAITALTMVNYELMEGV